MPKLRFPMLGYTEDALFSTAFTPPQRALIIAAWLCDVEKVQEDPKGSNRGEWIDEFLRAAKTSLGQPWCAAFVNYCLVAALVSEKDLPGGPAAVRNWRHWAKAYDRWQSSPERCGLFVLASSHIGFVAGYNKSTGIVQTIEGNTNDEGSREGFEVCRRERPVGTIEGFISLKGL